MGSFFIYFFCLLTKWLLLVREQYTLRRGLGVSRKRVRFLEHPSRGPQVSVFWIKF